jgi:ligand-binding SRPBCC domain-containing protein
MSYFEAVQWLPMPRPKVFAFFCDPANLPRIMPPELRVRIEWAALVVPAAGEAWHLERDKAAGAGSEFVFSFRPLPLLPIRMKWRARIEEFELDSHFHDTQVSGPMRRWSHRHEFQAESRNDMEGTLIRDRIEFEIGYGRAGKAVERYFVLPALQKSFAHRQSQVERALLPPQNTPGYLAD